MINNNTAFGLEEGEDKDLLSFYWFKGGFSSPECDKIINIARRFPRETGTTFGDVVEPPQATIEETPLTGFSTPLAVQPSLPAPNPPKYRDSKLRWMPLEEDTQFIFDKIRTCCLEANKELFKLDLAGFTEDLQFTEYEGAGKHYDWHPDIGGGKNKRKLSVVIQLSDPDDYTGGDLILNTGHEIVMERGRGNIIIFPSFLLHKVSKMKSGNRYSIVSWVSGTPWR